MRKIIVLTLTFLFATIGLKAQVELTSTGTGGSYSLSVPGAFQLRDGIQVTFKAHVNSAAGATMNVSGSGNVSIVKDGGANALAAGDIIVGQVVTLAYADAKWQMITPTGTPAVASNDWSLTGNAISAGNQLGTTNAFDLSIIAGGTAAITIDDVSQNIGIGVVPSTFYKIYTNIPVSNTTTTTAHEIQHNYSGASTKTGVSSVVSANGTGLKRAFYGFASATGSQQTDGFYSLIDNDGTGDAHGVYNDFSLSTGSGAQEGMRNIISNAGTSFKRGIFTSINQSGGANTSDMTGVHNSITSSSTASQDMFGILNQLTNNSSSGTTYGIYQTFSGTSSGTQYGIYASGEDQNYFSGNLGVGIPSPAQKLHVEGGRLRVANGASNADLYQSGSNTLLVTSGQFQIHANGSGPEFTIDDGNANFYVPLLIQDGSQATNRVLTSDASGYASWTDLSAISAGSTAWTRSAGNIYPTNINDFVGIGTTPTTARLSVVNNLANNNVLFVSNETGGTTSVVGGTKGGRISVTSDGTEQKTGLEIQLAGTGTGQQNAIFASASGAATGSMNRGIVASASNNASTNVGADLFADGNSGTNYGLRVNTGGTQAAAKYAVYLSSAGSGTKYGVYATGEDHNYLSGNLGVGLTIPTAKTQIHSTSGSGNLRLTSAGTGSNATDGFSMSNDGTTEMFMTQHENANWYFATNGNTTAMTISPSGKVGVGMTSPNAQLEVQNTTASATEKVGTFSLVNGTGGGANVGLRGYATGATSSNYGVNANAYGNSGTKYGVFAASSGTGTNYGAYFSATGGTNNYAIIVPSGGGNVGIGTASPSQALEVVGNIEIPATNEYMYASAKTNYYSVSAASFTHDEGMAYYLRKTASTSNFCYIEGGLTGSLAYSSININLPHGAVITNITAHIYDNDATYDSRIRLYRLAPGSATALATTAYTTGASTTTQTLSLATSVTIDNQNNYYQLTWDTYQNLGNTMRLYGIFITYTVTNAD